MNINYFSIGEVAKLTNVSRQTLIFYDKQNILKPAFVDENKYRYYSFIQIDLLHLINMLKEFDTPLKVIKAYVENRNKEGLLALLDIKKIEMQQKIIKTENYIKVIDYKHQMTKAGLCITDPTIISYAYREAIPVLLGEELNPVEQNDLEYFKQIYELNNTLSKEGLISLDLDVIVKQDQLTDDYKGYVSYFCMRLDGLNTDLKTYFIPEGFYISTYHQGSYDTTKKTYKRLFEYMEEHQLILDGDAHEQSVIDFFTEIDSQDFLLKISLKVKKLV